MKAIIKNMIYTILSIIIGICMISDKTYAGSFTGSTTGANNKIGRVENIKIIRKPKDNKIGRVENIKITRIKRKIATGVNDIVSEDVVIIKPVGWDHIFLPKGSTTKKVSQDFKSPYVINGSYFWKDNDGDFHPAGEMGTNGKSTITKELCNDPNLCGMYDIDTLKISENIVSGTINGNLRSSGPLLIREGIIADSIKNDRSHRNKETQRTALINAGSPYFIYSKIGMTLYNFTSIIKKYFPNGSAINLDGGSSTSFYSDDVSFNSSKLLPEFFLLR